MAENDILNPESPLPPQHHRHPRRRQRSLLGREAASLALPFQRSAEIDTKRIAKILGVNPTSVSRMIEAGLIQSLRILGEKRPRIEYAAVVDYCNRLRLEYRIPASALPKLHGRRHRDEDLLPFPLAENLSVADVQAALECTYEVVRRLIGEGVLVAYQPWIGERGSPWRIQKQSVERYVASLHAQIQVRAKELGKITRTCL